MKAKDTVQLFRIRHLVWCEDGTLVDTNLSHVMKTVAEAQAEISFKVGCQEGWDMAKKELETNPEILRIAREELEEAKKAGIKEVVEWMMENYPEVCDNHLEAKLKEWGI